MEGATMLQRIENRGAIRVGFFSDALPFVFHNEEGVAVGYDVDLAGRLANDLDVSLELVEVGRKEYKNLLNQGYLDVVMSGVFTELDNSILFTDEYATQSIALLVPDHRRDEFFNYSDIQAMDSLRLGVMNVKYYVDKVKRFKPDAYVERFDSPREFCRSRHNDIDAFVYSAEAGSAWSLVYPDFSVVVPQPNIVGAPVSIAVPGDQLEFARFLNVWINLKKHDRTLNDLYDHWILGQSPVLRKPRWCIARDVLNLY
jgi:ABC-type amino acid transport substrate-binding protein